MPFCLRGHKWWQNDEQYQNHYINQKDTHNNRLYINFGRKSANYVCSLIANTYKDSLFGQNNELNSCTINHLVELMSQFPETDISFVHASEELITVTTPCLCAVCVCVLRGVYVVFLWAPDSDSSKSQPPADTASASRSEGDPPTSHRRCDSFSPIWPEDENTHTKHTPHAKKNIFGHKRDHNK